MNKLKKSKQKSGLIKTIINKANSNVKRFRTKGMVGQSSKFLIETMLNQIDFSKKIVIVQFGSGKGVFVKALLKQMGEKSKLIVFEIDKECNKYISDIDDTRLKYINDGAENLEKYVKKSPDIILSTLPLCSLPNQIGDEILDVSEKKLKAGGYFLQYQYFLTDKKRIEEKFGEKAKTTFEIRNFPPAFVYKLVKT